MNASLSHRRGLILLAALAVPAWSQDPCLVEAQVAEQLGDRARRAELIELALFETYRCTNALLARAHDTSLSSSLRVQAIEVLTLVSTRDTRVPDMLSELLKDSDPAVVQVVECALSPSEVMNALAEAFAAGHPSPRVRRRVFDELDFFAPWTPSLVSAVKVALEDPELKNEALDLLLLFGPEVAEPASREALAPLLLEVFPSLPPERRQGLITDSSPSHAGVLALGLRDPHPAIRRSALGELTFGNAQPQLTPLILAALSDPDPTVQEMALWAILERDLSPAEVLPPLLEISRTNNDEACSIGAYTLDEHAESVASHFVDLAEKRGTPA